MHRADEPVASLDALRALAENTRAREWTQGHQA